MVTSRLTHEGWRRPVAWLLAIAGATFLAVVLSEEDLSRTGRSLAGAVASPTSAVAPGPDECIVPPRDVDEVMAVVTRGLATGTIPATPAGGLSVTARNPVSVSVAGTPWVEMGRVLDAAAVGSLVSPAVEAEVRGTIREFEACLNAADYPRIVALVSDRYLLRIVGRGDADAATWRARLEAPPDTPDAKSWDLAVVVVDIRSLPDGRVAAVVVDGSLEPNEEETRHRRSTRVLLFVEERGQWVRDEEIISLRLPDPTPTTVPATPDGSPMSITTVNGTPVAA